MKLPRSRGTMSPFETSLSAGGSRAITLPRQAVFFAILVPLVLGGAMGHSRLDAADASTAPPAVEDVWLISTRWSKVYDAPDLHVWRRLEGQWVDSTTEEFLASTDPSVPTAFWIHGDRVDHWESAGNGLTVHRRMQAFAEGRPFRFVIWGWPASEMHGTGPLEETRIKAGRADREALSLAWFLDQIEPSTPVSLIGYSFGARIATGALHLLGGGRLVGRELNERLHPDRHPMRAVLLAAALDNYSLARGQRNGRALSQVDQLLNLYNSCDEVLKWYPKLCGLLHEGPEAAGYTGLVGNLGDGWDKVRQADVSGSIGDSHDWQDYFCTRWIAARIADVALFPELAEPPSNEQPAEPTARRPQIVMPPARLKR